jgi:hypothetical protein
MLFKKSESIRDAFFKKKLSDVNEISKMSGACKDESPTAPGISIKKKLTYLKKRFARVKDDPFLMFIMKLIAKQYIDEEKSTCH